MTLTIELAADWIAIGLYAAACVAFTVGTMFGKPDAARMGVRLAATGLAAHAAAIGLRWVRVGHGPYLGFHEVSSLLALMAVAGFLLVVRNYPALRAAGVAIMPVAFVVMGGALLVTKEAKQVTGMLTSIWLAIHVLFANLAFGAYAVAFVIALAFMMKNGTLERRWGSLLDRFPEQDVLDTLSFRFIGAGFVFQTVMIVSGSIWANEAWGRYWGWDPVETWSLIAWAVYAIYLHVTLTMGWRGKRAAWIAIVALPVILFSLLGVPIAYSSIHGAYLAR